MSLKKQKNGNYLLTIYLKSSGRVRLVGYSDRRASLKLEERIKQLDACKIAGENPSVELRSWLETIPDTLKRKLVNFYLIDKSHLDKSKSALGHLNDFIDNLKNQESKGAIQKKRIRLVQTRITRLIDDCGFEYLSDIKDTSVDRWISNIYKAGDLSAKSCNHYLQAMKQFCRWLVNSNRMQDNPVAMLKPIKLNTNNTQQRRALTEEEIAKLLKSAEESDDIYGGLNGRVRSLVYQLALTSGLRHNEIRTLLRDDFDLESGTVTVRDINAKNSKTEVLPLQDSLRQQLIEYYDEFPALPKAKAFERMGAKGFIMIKNDLETAGIEYETEEGKADFHALRHTFCSLLAKNGVLPQTAQRLMRHSDINLTMKAYTHILIGDKKLAIAALPEIRKTASSIYNTVLKVGSGGENSGGEFQAISAEFNDTSPNYGEQNISKSSNSKSASDPYKTSTKRMCAGAFKNKNNSSKYDTNGGGGGNRTRVLQYHPKELLRV